MVRVCMMVLLLVATCPECASSADADRIRDLDASSMEPAPSPLDLEPQKKMRAPVKLALSASGPRDTLTLNLKIEATANIPRAVTRFALPEGVLLVSGPLEQDLGGLVRGAAVTSSIVVRSVSPVLPAISAGVDCYLSPGVKLYGVTQLTLGTPELEDIPRRDLRGEGIRGAPARPSR